MAKQSHACREENAEGQRGEHSKFLTRRRSVCSKLLWHTREDQNQEQPLNSVTEVSIGRINGRAETDIGIAASKRQAIVLQIVSKK